VRRRTPPSTLHSNRPRKSRGARSRTATAILPSPHVPTGKQSKDKQPVRLSLLPAARRHRLPLPSPSGNESACIFSSSWQPASIRFSLLNPPVAISNPDDHRVRHYFSRSQPIDSTSPSPFLPHPPVDSSTCSFPPDGGGNRPTHPRPPPSPRQFSLESSSFGVPVASDLLLAADGAACASPGRPHSPCLLAHAAGGP